MLSTGWLYSPKSSAFDATMWDKMEAYRTLLQHPDGLNEDGKERARWGHSFLQDALYFAEGVVASDSPIGRWWNSNSDKEWAMALRATKSGTAERAFAAYSLATKLQDAWSRTFSGTTNKAPSSPDKRYVAPEDVDIDFDLEEDAGEVVDRTDGLDADAALGRIRLTKRDIANANNQATAYEVLCGLMPEQTDTSREYAMKAVDGICVDAFADLLGWARKVIGGAALLGQSSSGEMTGYSTNGLNEHTVARDTLAVADGDMLALVRLSENNLVCRRYFRQDPVGAGPVILLRDETGSMDGLDGTIVAGKYKGHTRDQVAKGFELALARAFNDAGRDLISVAWSSNGFRTCTYGDPDCNPAYHLRLFLDGASHIERGLRESVRIASEYVPGDILIMTDGALHASAGKNTSGMCQYLSEIVQPVRESGGLVWAMTVWAEGGGRERVAAETLAWCDHVVSAKAIEEGDVHIEHLLRGIASRADNEEYGAYL